MKADTGAVARARAARILQRVLDGGATLPQALAEHAGERTDEGFVRELCWGSCRHYFRLDEELQGYLRQPLRDRDQDIRALLLLGLYQLRELQVPVHAALHATVGATEVLRKRWARGLVNAVLRNASRQPPADIHTLSPRSRYNLPDWWLRQLQQDWPDHWQEIAAAGSARPPLTLRSTRKATLEAAALAEHGIEAYPGQLVPTALYLQRAQPLETLPGFSSGELSVQDEGAQLAALLLDAEPGHRLLDACAAPGGKTLQLRQLVPDADVTALEIDPGRSQRIAQNLARAGCSAHIVTGDGRDPAEWWDHQPFDRILLDAPCSATGIVRRQPDIRIRRQADDLQLLARLQGRLLAALWPLLRPGGRLLYSTCSVMKCENEAIVGAFLGRQGEARLVPLTLPAAQPCSVGMQLLPTADAHDGFYFALLERTEH